jgi:hypothetical protein
MNLRDQIRSRVVMVEPRDTARQNTNVGLYAS